MLPAMSVEPGVAPEGAPTTDSEIVFEFPIRERLLQRFREKCKILSVASGERDLGRKL